MEVSCEKCGARYLFDESRIPDAGLAVKCSKCAHVFQAHRVVGSRPPAAPSEASGAEWAIRRSDGSTLHLRELSTLQRWIVERKVVREDLLSKTGTSWQSLGSIGDLEPFFDAMDGRAAASGLCAASPESHEPDYRSGPVQVTPGAWGHGAASGGTGPHPVFDGGGSSSSSGPMPQRGPRADLDPVTPVPDDDDDFDDLFPKRRNLSVWFLLLMVVAVGAAGGFYYSKPALVRGWLARFLGPSQAARDAVAAGYTTLARDSNAAVTEAIALFEKALVLHADYAEARAGLAEAHVALAENAAELAQSIAQKPQEAKNAEQDARAATIAAHRATAETRFGSALAHATAALAADPVGLATNRAMADYHRAKGDFARAKELLAIAARTAPQDARVLAVRAMVLAAQAASASEATELLEEVLTRSPQLNRARFTLARLHRRVNRVDESIAAVEQILANASDHVRAQGLLAELRALQPAPEKAPAQSPEPAETIVSLLAQADRWREADRADRALRLYERALDLDSEDPDVHTGLGWCRLDLDEVDGAVRSFKRALAVAPRFSDAHMGLAEAYRTKGMRRDAVKHYRQYLHHYPNGPDAPVARRMLERLRQ